MLLDLFFGGGEWGGRDGGEKVTGTCGRTARNKRLWPPNENPQVSLPTCPFWAVAGPQHEVEAVSRIKSGNSVRNKPVWSSKCIDLCSCEFMESVLNGVQSCPTK